MPDTDRLLLAVLALTDRYHVEAVRDDHTKVRVRHRPRLRQLRDSIHPSSNRDSGGKAARERSLIDAGALDLYRNIEAKIHKAAATVGADVKALPELVLKRWLIAARQKLTSDAYENEWAGRIESWARQIDARLNPPTVVEIEANCPECGMRTVYNRESDDNEPALAARYWKSGQEGLDGVIIRCANPECAATWEGMTGARACRWEIDQAERGRIEAASEVRETPAEA